MLQQNIYDLNNPDEYDALANNGLNGKAGHVSMLLVKPPLRKLDSALTQGMGTGITQARHDETGLSPDEEAFLALQY